MFSMPSRRIVLPLACAMVTSACFSPDPPLLATTLPGGYVFRSNGGDFGNISPPGGGTMDGFGILDHNVERWCAEFGREDAIVVCRYQQETARAPRDIGYFILDTRNGVVVVAGDADAARVVLQRHGIAELPTLQHRFWSTRRGDRTARPRRESPALRST